MKLTHAQSCFELEGTGKEQKKNNLVANLETNVIKKKFNLIDGKNPLLNRICWFGKGKKIGYNALLDTFRKTPFYVRYN